MSTVYLSVSNVCVVCQLTTSTVNSTVKLKKSNVTTLCLWLPQQKYKAKNTLKIGLGHYVNECICGNNQYKHKKVIQKLKDQYKHRKQKTNTKNQRSIETKKKTNTQIILL